MKFPNKISTYMIVIKNNEASEFYANYCKPSWEQQGLKVKTFDAVVPSDLSKRNELRFKKYSDGKKYVMLNLKAEITDTEKACFYSHYDLWKKSSILNKPILVLEHDTYLEHPENLWYDNDAGIIFYDKAAMGSYIIKPWFATMLCEYIEKVKIGAGPYSMILYFGQQKKLRKYIVSSSHPMFISASNQVMSDKYGNTIEHYCNEHPHHFDPKYFHKFIKI